MFDYEYSKKIIDLLSLVEDKNREMIPLLAEKLADNIINDKIIHVFGTGHSHMIGIELFGRAGGLANVNALLDPDTLTSFGAIIRSSQLERLPGIADIIYENYTIEAGDIMIITSNSGRNSLPIEMAMRCKKEDVYVIALTNLEQSKAAISRHPSGQRLFEIADCVLDNCVPSGDALLDIDGIKTGAGSSIASMFLLNIITSEALKLVTAKGYKPYVFQSQNVDGYNNDAIYAKYKNRIKHF